MKLITYRMRAIISRGFYIFYPIFKDHFFVFKEVFSENSVLMYDLYSRVAHTVILFKGKGGQFQPQVIFLAWPFSFFQISYFHHCIKHLRKLSVWVSFSKRLFLAKLYLYLLISESADANQGVRKQFIKSTFQIDRDVKRKHKIR